MTIRQSNFGWVVGVAAIAGILVILSLGGISACTQQQASASPLRTEDKMATGTSGFYCNLKAFTPEEREHHRRLSQKLAGARVDTEELADGFAFRLEPGVSLAELADWVVNERKCCPFFDFDIEVERDGGPLWLKLRGSEGVKQFIRSEFGIRP